MVPRQLIAQPRLGAGSYSPAGEPEQAAYPAVGQPAVGQPAVGQPAAGPPSFGQPSASEPTGGQPAVQPAGLDPDLPKRPRGSTLAAASRPQPDPAVAAPPPPRDTGARFAAFREAGERSRSTPPGPQDDETT